MGLSESISLELLLLLLLLLVSLRREGWPRLGNAACTMSDTGQETSSGEMDMVGKSSHGLLLQTLRPQLHITVTPHLDGWAVVAAVDAAWLEQPMPMCDGCGWCAQPNLA